MTLTCPTTMRQPSAKRTQVCVWRPTLPGVVGRWKRVDAIAKSRPDHGPRQGSGKTGGRTRRPERCDFLMAVQILRLTVAHRARIIAEYLIECRDVIGDQ